MRKGHSDRLGLGWAHLRFKNVFYHKNLLPIGGIESFMYYLVRMYGKNYDITIMYSNADAKQVERLSQFCNCVKYTGGTIECERFFGTYDTKIYDCVEADYIAQVIHANYKNLKLQPFTHPKISEYIAVSESVAKAYEELCGIKCEVIYNPLLLEKPRKMLHLVSATRLTKEKGKSRMEALANLMTENSIAFQWLVFTDSSEGFKNPSFIKVAPRLDLTDIIADADYLVQLSDTEGYCYSVNEALNLGTPVIVTDLDAFKEQGIQDGVNGYFLPLDMNNINIKKIANNIPKFKYEQNPIEWEKMLAEGQGEYLKNCNKKIKVEATGEYIAKGVYDSRLGKIPLPGDAFEVEGSRLLTLLGNNPYGVAFVRVVEANG